MLNQSLALIAKHSASGAFIDTNLMLLMAVGNYDRDRIASFKRTNAFRAEEYDLLGKLLSRCRRLLTTPNVLTEVDNLLRQLPEREHKEIAKHTQQLVASMFEVYHESKGHLGGTDHELLGLTDAILIRLAKSHLIITSDFPLASRIASLGYDVINFNHLRRYAK